MEINFPPSFFHPHSPKKKKHIATLFSFAFKSGAIYNGYKGRHVKERTNERKKQIALNQKGWSNHPFFGRDNKIMISSRYTGCVYVWAYVCVPQTKI
jgi:hypothetical protein